MRNVPGWVAGALGVGAVVGAFYLGGRTGAVSAPVPATPTNDVAALAPTAPPVDAGVAVECEPGQRAVVRASAGAAPSVSCVSEARPVAARAALPDTAYAPMATATPVGGGLVTVSDGGDRPYARPAVLTGPTEVYVPRTRTVSREVEAPKRTVKKSVAIIAGSTAVGAVAGGLVKGKKGAVVGGLLGGGAATVWDQVTRRQHDNR